MTSVAISPDARNVDSTQAISARAKEIIRMQAHRYQKGSLSLVKRKTQSDQWVFRYYAEEGGHRVYKRKIVGSTIEFPKRKDAEKAVMQLRVDINDGAAFAPINLEQLCAHYERVELPSNAYSTIEGYKSYLNLHIIPKWGKHSLTSIKTVDVEAWLGTLNKVNGDPASPGTKTKIRNIMSGLFSHAIRHEWASKNPITEVRTSAKRQRSTDILTPEEFQAALPHLKQRELVMVLLAGSTALRRGEWIGLYWRDMDFILGQANVTHAIWRNVEGRTKTQASTAPVPLHPIVMDQLRQWRAVSLYKADDDLIFPSIRKNGTQPLAPDMVLRDHVRPALERAGITKQIGWHSFRHGMATMLRVVGVDLKVAQEILRHANSRITQDVYQQTVGDEKRAAQSLAFQRLLGGVSLQHPSAPSKE